MGIAYKYIEKWIIASNIQLQFCDMYNSYKTELYSHQEVVLYNNRLEVLHLWPYVCKNFVEMLSYYMTVLKEHCTLVCCFHDKSTYISAAKNNKMVGS